MKKIFKTRGGLIFLVVLVGFILRAWAAFQLPVDADEPTYMTAAYDYASMIKTGNLNGIIDYSQNNEHPPLVKLLYGLAIITLPSDAGWADALLFSRMISVVFGTLAVLLLSFVSPLAGALLAIQNMGVKYTSEAYLEALPLFASVAAVASLHFSKKTRDRLFWLSAVALGLIAAGKYSYFPVLLVILFIFFVEKKYPWRDLLLYMAVGLVTFFVLDPYLWHDPFRRFYQSALFHAQYSQGAHVKEVHYPWYQPFLWISQSWPETWHPQVFFFFSFDRFIFLLSLAGAYFEWKQRRWSIIWYLAGLFFLLLWPTKWPQYTLVVIPAICLTAGTALSTAGAWVKEKEDYWGWFSAMIPNPGRVFYVALFGTLAFLIIFLSVNAITISINRKGWDHMTAEFTDLPSNTVNAIIPYQKNKMALATQNGAAIWTPRSSGEVQDQWVIFTRQNSALPDNAVYSVAAGDQGLLWFGTRSGLARYDGKSWQVFHSNDFGLSGQEVLSVVVTTNGGLWVGTNAGAAFYDGQKWTSYTTTNSGILDNHIFALAVDQESGRNRIWFGTSRGLCSLDISSKSWTSYTSPSAGLGTGGVPDVMVDSSGQVWVATLGEGVAVWDGSQWKHFRVSNSELPTNSVRAVQELGKGEYWISTQYSDQPGGIVSKMQNNQWKNYLPYYTGYSGSETVTISQDSTGRYWFGTLNTGIDFYTPQK